MDKTVMGDRLTTTFNPGLESALAHADLGRPVFPCWWTSADGSCACSNGAKCASPGKHPYGPYAPRGFKDATTDEDTIRAWWNEQPRLNPAMPTGRVSKISVIDIDGHTGQQSLNDAGIDLPPTFLVNTPRYGGWHCWYQYNSGFRTGNGILPGIDLKNDGGYVMLPGAEIGGRRYFAHPEQSEEPVRWNDGPDVFIQPPEHRVDARRIASDEPIPVGKRRESALSMAGAMRRQGAGEEEIAAALTSMRCQRFAEPETFPDHEIAALAKDVPRRYQPGDRGVMEGFGRVSAGGFLRDSTNRDLTTESKGFGGFGTSAPLSEFPTHVFPPAIREYVEQCARTVGIAPDFIAAPLIAYVAGVIGRSYCLQIKKGWNVYPSFWVCVIAKTGAGKSPGGDMAREPVTVLQREAAERFEVGKTGYEDDLVRAKSDPDWVVRERPHMEQFITSDSTTEALSDLLQHGTGVTVACDELLGWILKFDAYRSGQGGDRQSFLSMWSNEFIKIDRKRDDPIVIDHPVVNVTGGIQPEQLHRLDDEVSTGDGFLPRFNFVMLPEARPLRWNDDELPEEYLDRVVDLLRPLRRPQDEDPQTIRLSNGAREEFVSWMDENSDAQEGAHPFVRAVFAKYPQHCARFALVLHCLDHTDDPASTRVPRETMLRAITVAEYFRDHALRVMSALGTVGALQTTTLVGPRAKLFHAVERDDGEWVRLGVANKRVGGISSGEGVRLLGELERAGYVESRAVPTDELRGGRPTTEWRSLSMRAAETSETPNANVNEPE